jgi:hypothetical protein
MEDFYRFMDGNFTVERGYGEFCQELEKANNDGNVKLHEIPIELLVSFLEFMSLKEDLGLIPTYLAPNKED